MPYSLLRLRDLLFVFCLTFVGIFLIIKWSKDAYWFVSFSADLADLIFVFFDPIGQALCKRTLNLVEKINEKHAERMRCVVPYILLLVII